MLSFLQLAVENNFVCQDANQYQFRNILQIQMVYLNFKVSSIPLVHFLAAHHVN